MSSSNKRILLITGSLALALLGLELAARAYLRWLAPEEVFQRFATVAQIGQRLSGLEASRKRPHHYIGYVGGSEYRRGPNRHNSLGFRGEEFSVTKPKGEFRIVCLGGSTTYTGGVKDYRKAYPQLLESRLKERGHDGVRVINAGLPGYTTWETLLNYQLRVEPLNPDLVIVYHGINDIEARGVWPPEAFTRDNGGYRAPRISTDTSAAWEASALLRLTLIGFGLRESPGRVGNLYFVTPPTYVPYRSDLSREEKQELTRRALKANGPEYFADNLRDLVALCQARSVRVAIASFVLSDGSLSPRVEELRGEYVTAIEQQNEQIERLCEETRAVFLDFAAGFPKDAKYFTDMVHVNEAGAALKARWFADRLIREKLIPRTATDGGVQ